MILQHKEIPVEFLQRLPDGIKILKRHGQEFMVVEEVLGPKGESLMSEAVRIHGEASIRFGIRVGGQEGLIFVDAFWGGHAKLYSFLPCVGGEGSEVEAFVPETGDSLMTGHACEVEGCNCNHAIMLTLPDKRSHVYVCARLGCPGHAIEMAELPPSVSRTISTINFLGAGSMEDDWFDSF